MVKKSQEVLGFLAQVKQLIDEGKVRINNKPWNDKENKTLTYMAETGIKRTEIYAVIKELSLENYCATKPDMNDNFQNEEIWEFGIRETLVDIEEDFYIKLKVKELGGEWLLVMSFHPEQPSRPEKKLKFPYRNEKR